MAALRTIARFEPLLVLLAGPPLVFTEAFPPAARAASLAWIALLWAVRFLATGRLTVSTPLDPPVVALVLMIPAAVAAAGPESVAAALSRVYSLIFALAVFYALANGIARARHAWSAAMWLLLAGMGLTAVGLVTVDWLEKMPGAPAVISRLPSAALTMPHPTLEAGVHPNQLAGLLVLFVPLAVALLLWPRPAGGDGGAGTVQAVHTVAGASHFSQSPDPSGPSPLQRPPAVRGIAVLSLVAVMPTLLFTQSRGAWLALAVALAAMAVAAAWGDAAGGAARARGGGRGRGRGDRRWEARRRSRRAAAVVAVVVVIAVSSPAVLALVRGQGGGATEVGSPVELLQRRVSVWADVMEMIGGAPLAGVGLNTFPLVYDQRPEYEGHYVYAGIAHAHNTLLQSAVDFGLPGMVAVVGMIAALGWTGLRAAHRLGQTPMAPLVVGLSFGLLAHALHGLVDAVAIGSKTGFVPWAFAGTLVAIRLRARAWNAGDLPLGGDLSLGGEADESGPASAADPSGYHRFGWAPPMVAWIATSAMAFFLAQDDSVFAAIVAVCSGGALFGVLSARRLDGHRERVRRKRTRRKPTV